MAAPPTDPLVPFMPSDNRGFGIIRFRLAFSAIVVSLSVAGLSPCNAQPAGADKLTNSTPAWNADFAASLIGDLCLIGVTVLDGEKVVERYEMHGRVVSVSPTDGIVYELLGHRSGEQWKSPPHFDNFRKAEAGIYTQKSDGDKVENPDWLVTWEIHQPPN